MTHATPPRALRTEINLPHAVLAAGALVAIAILGGAILGGAWAASGKEPSIIANPQGGVWIKQDDTLYLCRASPQGAAPCINLADGSTVTFADLAR
jgi:hypothetical protein